MSGIIGFPHLASKIPTIGAPFKVHGVLVNVVVECNCTESSQNKQSLVLHGIDGAAQCPDCGKVYMVGSMKYDIQMRNLEVNMAIDISRARPEVPNG